LSNLKHQKIELNKLISIIEKELSNDNRFQSVIDYGSQELNAFSITFWVNFNGTEGEHCIYVKIPKFIFYDKSINFSSPISKIDKKMAQNELNSLIFLSEDWDTTFGVFFVKYLAYIEEFNAIITERINGSLMFKEYRKSDLQKKYKDFEDDRVISGLYNFGKSLRSFHNKSSIESSLAFNEVTSKFESYFNFLKSCGVSSKFFKKLYFRLTKHSMNSIDTYKANNLKGIDVRQIFFEKKDSIRIIDPGKLSKGFIEIDLARFIVTCRILYWGTFKIFFKKTPNKSYENSFLKGYFETTNHQNIKLNILIIKEYLKQWKITHEALLKRKWPYFFKFVIKRLYIDPFYKKLILEELVSFELNISK
jgi:hypothetical protein